MKKSNKKVGNILLTIIGAIILFFVIFIVVDCLRLKNAESGTKPLITISEEHSQSGRVVYNGLGYSVIYYEEFECHDNTVFSYISIGHGAEFWFFDRFLIWSWEE